MRRKQLNDNKIFYTIQQNDANEWMILRFQNNTCKILLVDHNGKIDWQDLTIGTYFTFKTLEWALNTLKEVNKEQ